MATNTTNSFTNHTGNNTAGPFSISFDYLAESEVVVTVGGVVKTQTTHYTFPSATTISFTSGNHPANSAVIKFQRNTSVSSKKVDFQDGSVLTEADLDSNTNQLLYGFQEFLDDGPITEADLLDEDNMASNSATKAATQQSIKAYVDASSEVTNLSYTAGTRELASSTGTNVNLPEATTSNAGLQSSSDKTKLDGIETSATADQTAAEIRTLVESATDSNVFTDADHTKLNAIEASATADQTNAEIRTAVEAASDSNVFTDADHTKLNAIEASATADQTGAEIKTAYEAESNTNAYTDAEKTKLSGIAASANNYSISSDLLDEDNMASNSATKAASQQSIKAYVDGATGTATNLSATANGTSLTVESSSGNNVSLPAATTSAWGVMSDDDKTKLDGIASNANVGLTDLVGDTTPQLGGNLDVNSQDIVSTSNGDIDLDPNGSGKVVFKGNATKGSGQFKLNCENNSHGIVIKGPPHSAAASYTLTLPNTDGSANQVLKTDGSGNLDWVAQTTDTNTQLSNAEVRTAVEAATDSNVFTDADHTKLNAIEASADVTDATNVNAAGAVMNSDLATKGQILIGDGSGDPSALSVGTNDYVLTADSSEATGIKWAAAASGGISNVVEDTTPQLGGNLDVQAREITTSTANGNIVLNPNGEFGVVRIKGDSTNTVDGTLELRCSSDSHGVKIKSPPHSAAQNYTLTLPSSIVNGAFLKTDSNGGLSFATPTDTNTQLSNAEVRTAVEAASDSNVFTDADHTKLNAIAASANNYVHPNHSGEVTSTADGATVIADNIVDEANLKVSNSPTNGYFLQAQSGNTGGLTWAAASGGGGLSSDAQGNTVGGSNAGDSFTGTDAENNTLIGKDAGTAITTADHNSALGWGALDALSTGSSNTAIGQNALGAATTSSTNTAVGAAAMAGTTTGGSCTAVGYGALTNNTTGPECTAVGYEALNSNTTTDRNTAVGYQAAKSVTTAGWTTAVGWKALADDTAGSSTAVGGGASAQGNHNSCTAVGYKALYGASGGQNANSVAVGVKALENANAANNNNTAIGFEAADSITSGTNNIIIGANADASAATVSNEITLGDSNITKFRIPGLNFVIKDTTATDNYVLTVDANGEAGWEAAAGGGGGASTGESYVLIKNGATASDTGSTTIAGYQAGESLTGGASNTFFGNLAGKEVTSATGVTAIGAQALEQETTVGYTTAVGYKAGQNNTANWNVAVGAECMMACTTGNDNTAIGGMALRSTTTGSGNVAVGESALKLSTTGIDNTGLGNQAGNSITTGNYNTAVGANALTSVTTGFQNLAFGASAAQYATGASNAAFGYKAYKGVSGSTTGSNNCSFGEKNLENATTAGNTTSIGYRAGRYITTGNDNTCIGAQAGDALTTGSNNLILGHDAAASAVDVSNEITLGDSNIATLRCQVTSITALSDRRDKTDINTLDLGLDFINSLKPVKFKWDSREGIAKDGTYEAGFIAQDFQQVQQDNDANYLGLVLESNPDKLEATPGKLIPILVKAIQELKMEVETLKNNG